VAAYLNRDDIDERASATVGELVLARRAGDRAATQLLDDAARALGHLIATFAGALQSTCIVLAGEDVAALESPVLTETVAERLRPGPHEVQRCILDIVTTPLTFSDWARGAAVAGIQHVLGGT
jgi:predicted NBD/HSP70 family sugar kinase